MIDPVDPGIESALAPAGQLGGQLVRGWRVRRPAGSTGGDGAMDYIELELSEPGEHRIESTAGQLILRLRSKEPSFLLPPTGAQVLGAPPAAGSAPSDLWGLEQSLVFGLNRHRPVRIAREEVELAQMKVREARRQLYPVASLKFSWTDGVASNVGFREYTAGLQVEQPLYYSGRLIEAYRQSLVNLKVAQKRQGKVKSDFSLDVGQAYYEYMGAKSARKTQEGLVGEAEGFLRQAQQRSDKGLLTRLEVLNIEAQLNQAKFQRATSENDLALARLKFLSKLGLDPPSPFVDVPDFFPAPEVRPVDLEGAMQLALQNKPDIQVNSLLVQFHEYEVRVAKAKQKLKVDLSGFIGSSAAAFESEPLDSGEDYFVGLKATRAWGKHSTNASVTKTKTSPRLGQTTRTESTVYSTEMNLVDQYPALSEIEQGQVNLEKARRDLEEARSATIQEVQEAYISYEKARLQMEYARQKIAFREEQVKILKAQAGLNEALPSQVLEAIMKLAEERVAQVQGLSNYYVALARLNKAVGLTGHYQ